MYADLRILRRGLLVHSARVPEGQRYAMPMTDGFGDWEVIVTAIGPVVPEPVAYVAKVHLSRFDGTHYTVELWEASRMVAGRTFPRKRGAKSYLRGLREGLGCFGATLTEEWV